VRDTVRQRTYERYESIVRVHLVPSIGRVKLKALTPAHVRGLYREKLDAGLAQRSVLHIHRILSKALKQAVMNGLIPRNAAAPVKPPRPRREEIRPLGREQVRALFEAARGDRLEALYVLAVTAGLRRGEFQGLKWEDVDLEAGTLQVRRTLSEPKGGYIFEAPKSGKGRRYGSYRGHRSPQKPPQAPARGEDGARRALVRSRACVPLVHRHAHLGRQPQSQLQSSATACAGLPEIRFHDLRHTCATLLLRQGVNPKFVQELLGHADISLTLNVYSHVLPDMGDAAAGAMDAAIGE
jgi:integrase